MIPLPLILALAHLPPDEREAVIDNVLIGRSLDAIAREWGVSRETVAKRRRRGLVRLARLDLWADDERIAA